MFEEISKKVALDLLVGAVRHPNPATRRELAELFWDLKYLITFGIPKLPPLDVENPPFPDPRRDPTPTPIVERLSLHETAIFELVNVAAGDPSPQPSVAAILQDNEVRLSAVKGLAKRLTNALEKANQEIVRLEKGASPSC